MQEWNLIDETKSILGYDCKKATCKFRGREYEAWYTEDVPVSEGPWKFGGLPGFIMEIHDANNQYSYECVGINSSPDRTITIPDIPYNKTNRGKFYQTKYRFDTNPIEYMESTSGVKVIVSSPDGTPRNDLYGPRELNYDYIELDWK